MMLNDNIAISNPGGTLSGAGRNQAFKDGLFPGPCSSTNDPEPEQINFFSILSRLGVGTVQATPDESNNANPKLTEEQSPDGLKAEDAFSEKPKRKQGKDDCVVKQLSTASPDTLGVVIGLQTLQDQPQSTLSADPSFHAPGSENDKEVGAGSAALQGGMQSDMDQKDHPGIRHPAVEGKSASFLSAKDSAETGAIVAASAGASNAEDNETPNMFMDANQSGKIAVGEEDASFKPSEPESGNMPVNFSREGQMEKTSLVTPSPNASRPEEQSFHTEVLKQIVEKTSTNLKSGHSEIQIDLKPESLGRLRLFISSDQQQVTVKILAENIQVKEMIENQASLIKNELQQQGIHVHTVKVDMLMSGGSDFAYSQHEGAPFKQARHEPAYGSGNDHIAGSASKEPDSLDQVNHGGGSIVNYFA